MEGSEEEAEQGEDKKGVCEVKDLDKLGAEQLLTRLAPQEGAQTCKHSPSGKHVAARGSICQYCEEDTAAPAPQGGAQRTKIEAMQGVQQEIISDFKKYYDAMPYHGATEEAIFHDWMYLRLTELYAAPAPQVEALEVAREIGTAIAYELGKGNLHTLMAEDGLGRIALRVLTAYGWNSPREPLKLEGEFVCPCCPKRYQFHWDGTMWRFEALP